MGWIYVILGSKNLILRTDIDPLMVSSRTIKSERRIEDCELFHSPPRGGYDIDPKEKQQRWYGCFQAPHRRCECRQLCAFGGF